MDILQIGGRRIGPGEPVYVVAEAGVNHNASVDLARRLVDAAAAAGADAVKFQTFHADRVATVSAPKAAYQMRTTGAVETQTEMLRRLELPPGVHEDLFEYAFRRGVVFLSTPFDQDSVDLLERLQVPAFKIGSGELTNLPFLAYVAAKGRPIILSTGMADLQEVADAVETIRAAGNSRLVLLHCVSNYPADPADANLRAMTAMRGAFDLPVGFSDHMLGPEVALAAAALGAVVIEKHLTLDRALPGPDHAASMEPAEFAELVASIRMVERALGDGVKRPAASEQAMRIATRRSIVAARDLASGTVLTADMLSVKRPGSGILPRHLSELVGRRTTRSLRHDEIIRWEDLD